MEHSISGWQYTVHHLARDKGWWDDEDRSFAEQVLNMQAELSEAWEEWRAGHDMTEVYYGPDGKPEGISVELADTVIRILDTCERYGIDLEAVIAEKHAYNATREHRHGGKRA